MSELEKLLWEYFDDMYDCTFNTEYPNMAARKEAERQLTEEYAIKIKELTNANAT